MLEQNREPDGDEDRIARVLSIARQVQLDRAAGRLPTKPSGTLAPQTQAIIDRINDVRRAAIDAEAAAGNA